MNTINYNEKSWSIIKKNYLDKSKDKSINSEDAGLNLFIFQNPAKYGTYNCVYKFILKDSYLWDVIFSNIENKKVLSRYNQKQNFIICININIPGIEDIYSIELFDIVK